MATVQEIRAQMLRYFGELGSLQQNNRFLRSCISEGMIPKGLRVNFNLAKFVNDENLVNNLQDRVDSGIVGKFVECGQSCKSGAV